MSARLPKGPVKFVLGGSGHIAGIVNPPMANKYGYWVNDATDGNLPKDPATFLENATQHPGSWWTHWHGWLSQLNGAAKMVKARQPGAKGAKSVSYTHLDVYKRQIGERRELGRRTGATASV